MTTALPSHADAGRASVGGPDSNVEKREAYLATLPLKRREIVRRALTGAGSPRQAIKAKCLVCASFEIKEISQCTVWRCPLHAVRPYQSGD